MLLRLVRAGRIAAWVRRWHHLDRAPCELDPLLATQQLQQDEHSLVRTQGSEQTNLILQRALQDPHARTGFGAAASVGQSARFGRGSHKKRCGRLVCTADCKFYATDAYSDRAHRRSSYGLAAPLTPSPPKEKTAAGQDQTRQSCTGDGAGD